MTFRRPQPAVTRLLDRARGGPYPCPVPKGDVQHALFHSTMDWVFGREGGGVYHSVRGDPGGGTKWGISSRAFRSVDISRLTRPEAEALAWAFYWVPMKLENLEQDPGEDGLCFYLMDTAFNMGPARATTLVQQALGGRVEVDGQFGRKTLRALRDALHVDMRPHNLSRVAKGTRWSYVHTLHSERLQFYRTARGAPRFYLGWVRRANAALLRAAGQDPEGVLFW